MNILLLTLLLSAPHAAAEGNGPGCGSLTCDPSAFVVPAARPATPFGFAAGGGDAIVAVPRATLERTFGQASAEAVESFEGRWIQTLSARWNAESGLYDPSDTSARMIVSGADERDPDALTPARRTPFGPGAAVPMRRVLREAVLFEGAMGLHRLDPHGVPARMGPEGAEIAVPSTHDWYSPSYPPGTDSGTLSAVAVCRFAAPGHILCRKTIVFRVAGAAGTPRVEYYGFRRVKAP